jgi:hypothetical protein
MQHQGTPGADHVVVHVRGDDEHPGPLDRPQFNGQAVGDAVHALQQAQRGELPQATDDGGIEQRHLFPTLVYNRLLNEALHKRSSLAARAGLAGGLGSWGLARGGLGDRGRAPFPGDPVRPHRSMLAQRELGLRGEGSEAKAGGANTCDGKALGAPAPRDKSSGGPSSSVCHARVKRFGKVDKSCQDRWRQA